LTHQSKIINKVWRQKIAHWVDAHEVPETVIIFATAFIVGIGAGLGAVVFRLLINGVNSLAYGGIAGMLDGFSPLYLLIIPALVPQLSKVVG